MVICPHYSTGLHKVFPGTCAWQPGLMMDQNWALIDRETVEILSDQCILGRSLKGHVTDITWGCVRSFG